MFALHSPQNTLFRYDADCRNADDVTGTAIAFGLGFNGFTYLMSEAYERRLFETTWGPSPHKEFTTKTDNIFVPALGGELRPPNGCDYAIVARFVPKQQNDDRRHYFFVCAGRTASGTAAAGWFLANEWPLIEAFYGRAGLNLCDDGLLIIVRYPYDASGPADTDSSANIARLMVTLGLLPSDPTWQ